MRGAFDSAHSFHRAEGLCGMAWKKICLRGHRVNRVFNFSNRELFAIVVYTLDCARALTAYGPGLRTAWTSSMHDTGLRTAWTAHGPGLGHTSGIHGPGWDKRVEYTGLAGANGWQNSSMYDNRTGKVFGRAAVRAITISGYRFLAL